MPNGLEAPGRRGASLTAARGHRARGKRRNGRLAKLAGGYAIVFALAVLAGCAANSDSAGDGGRGVEYYEQLIRQELPLGSSPGRTIEFLVAQGTLHSERLAPDGTLYGIVRGVRHRFLLTTSIRMTFVFDENDRLRDYAVREIWTVP